MSETAATNGDVKVRGEFTIDPDTCKFTIDRPVLPGWTVAFRSAEEGRGSPLVDAVFAVPGIESVTIQDSTLSVKKSDPRPWPTLARELIPKLKEAFRQDRPAMSMAVTQALREMPTGGDMAGTIQKLIEEFINPALASHGGWVRLDRIEDRDVYLEMGGGCQGCAASRTTMQNGIENAIRDACPQVREIVDITDHQAGANPYYS